MNDACGPVKKEAQTSTTDCPLSNTTSKSACKRLPPLTSATVAKHNSRDSVKPSIKNMSKKASGKGGTSESTDQDKEHASNSVYKVNERKRILKACRQTTILS